MSPASFVHSQRPSALGGQKLPLQENRKMFDPIGHLSYEGRLKIHPPAMQKKSTCQSAFLNLRAAAIFFLLCVAAFLIATRTLPAFFRPEAPAQASERTLTFEERVSYQRAIEDVFWRHRIWPKRRPDPKPSLDAVMSQAQLEKKVADYLRNSQALEDYWQRAITGEQLQAEMDRMAKHTKQPEVLRELFEVLGNDPFVIAECLAGPVLTERLLAYSVANQVKQISQTYNQVGAATANYRLPTISDTVGGCIDDTWTATSVINAPLARIEHTAVWTGSEMMVWGGIDDSLNYLNSGGRYNPAIDSWTATNTTNAPAPRIAHTAVWTGSEMIVWGGHDGTLANTGARYNPATNDWIPTSTINAPLGRASQTAVWTGSEMIIWGGTGFQNTGGRYNPNTDSWTAMTTTNAPEGRIGHTAVWTGNEMIVWGGQDQFFNDLNTGGRYDPSTDSWTPSSTVNAPSGRYGHTAVWTGDEMIIWGGYDGSFSNSGGRYDPTTDSWTATSMTNTPAGRESHTAVWNGGEMIIWAGYDDSTGVMNTGGRFAPRTNSWTATSTINVPVGRANHTAVWTGSEMIVLGGDDGTTYFSDGGRYCAAAPRVTPRPRPTPHRRPTPP
jgi:N-acetylneuraminic acid mutarotase